MPTIQQVAAQLGLTVTQVLNLMANPAFPAPSSGNGLSATWSSGPINSFAAGFVTLLCREREVSLPQELSGRRDSRPPRGHRDGAKRAVRVGGDEVALDVESVVRGGVG